MGLYGLLSFVGVGVGILELNSPLLVVLLFFWDFVLWGFCFPSMITQFMLVLVLCLLLLCLVDKKNQLLGLCLVDKEDLLLGLCLCFRVCDFWILIL